VDVGSAAIDGGLQDTTQQFHSGKIHSEDCVAEG
jgi:hypothetical protein